MLNRFLIVVLAILNVGVALWWMVPSAPEPPAPEPVETGVARLELVAREAPPATTAVAATPAAEVADPPATTEHCLSLGPFADKAQAQAAVATLGADLLRSHLREVPPKAAGSYRVILPPAATREEAQATAKRIADAGFGDYFIMGQGEEANAIALGQYRSREGAERRQSELVEAGFPAQLLASGVEEAPTWWLDAAHADKVQAAALQRRSGAARQQVLDCVRLR